MVSTKGNHIDIKKAFGLALKKARNSKKLTQEEFCEVSNRTYISSLKRGKKSITLEKLKDISEVLNIHSLTLISLCCYINLVEDVDFELLTKIVKSEFAEITNKK